MFPRAFTQSAPALKHAQGTLAPPLRRTRDPLLSSPRAQHFLLPSGDHFIARPPPSVIPPSVPVPVASTSALPPAFARSPFANAVAPSPLAALSSSAVPASSEHLLPPLRPTPTQQRTPLSAAQVQELQQLRRDRPAYWTRSRLAAKFGVSQQVVGTLGWGEGPEARRAERERRERVEARQAKVEAQWGWKKEIARDERRRRRDMW
ncbi:hypothetical protein JCM10449v2_007036 [Rhodotorula kratochvilovae]